MPGVSEGQIDGLIALSVCKVEKMGAKTTVLHCTMPTGFEIVVSSACVDPSDYDAKVGREICLRRLKDKIWELEGYKAHDV